MASSAPAFTFQEAMQSFLRQCLQVGMGWEQQLGMAGECDAPHHTSFWHEDAFLALAKCPSLPSDAKRSLDMKSGHAHEMCILPNDHCSCTPKRTACPPDPINGNETHSM